MSKLGEVEIVISDLRSAAAAINEAANTLAALFSAEPNEAPGKTVKPAEAPTKPAEPVITREKVRAILSEKSRVGFTAQVKELLQKYGADRLSAVEPANYAALVADAEVLGNG